MSQVYVATMEVPPLETPLLIQWGGLLDEKERLRADRFRFAKDRLAFVAAHGLQRVMLGALLQMPAQDLAFMPPQPGEKPMLAGDAAGMVDVSISHTRGGVACVVGVHCHVGIDIEASSRTLGDETARFVFTESERHWIASATEGASGARAMTLWTLKEAISKALGLGLALDFSCLSLSCQSSGWQIVCWPEGHAPSDAWALRSWCPFGGFQVSLAIEHAEGNDVEAVLDGGALNGYPGIMVWRPSRI